jgi:hypothetical protein
MYKKARYQRAVPDIKSVPTAESVYMVTHLALPMRIKSYPFVPFSVSLFIETFPGFLILKKRILLFYFKSEKYISQVSEKSLGLCIM